MKLDKIIDYIKEYEQASFQLADELCNYFNSLVEKSDEQIFDEKLFLDITSLINTKISNNPLRVKVLKSIRRFYLMSYDRINETKYFEIANKINAGESSYDELYNYLNFNIRKYPQCLDIDLLNTFINTKFEINKMKSLLKLLNKVDKENILPYESEYVEKIIRKFNTLLIRDELYEVSKEFGKHLRCAVVRTEGVKKYLKNVQKALKNRVYDLDYSLFNTLRYNLKRILEPKFVMKIDSVKDYEKIKKDASDLYNEISANLGALGEIKDKLCEGIIEMPKPQPKDINFVVPNDDLSEDVREHVIMVDRENTLLFDTAFSIDDNDGVYNLHVYIPDVPSFLKVNPEICKTAYSTGVNMFMKSAKPFYFQILPRDIAFENLNLSDKKQSPVIDFSFHIKNNGEIEDCHVTRKRVKISDPLTYNQLSTMLSNDDSSSLSKDIQTFKTLSRILQTTSKYSHFQNLEEDDMVELVSITSLLVNYYVGETNDFAIYRENKKYVSEAILEKYTHSSTPLRNFVSDINLAFFLEQNGLVSFDDKDLNYVETHVDELVEHFNQQWMISLALKDENFVRKNLKR